MSNNSELCVPSNAQQEQLQLREGDGKWHRSRKSGRRQQTKKPYRITFRSSRYPQQPDMMSSPFDLEFVKGLLKIGNGRGEKKEWSLFAARDLVGVFTRDRWIVCVCL